MSQGGSSAWKRKLRNGAITACVVGLFGLLGPALMVDDTVMGVWAFAPFAGVLALVAGGIGVYATQEREQHVAQMHPELRAVLQSRPGTQLKHYLPEIVCTPCLR